MSPVDFPTFETHRLDYGLPLYVFKDNSVEAIQLILEIKGGRLAEKHPGIASAVAANFVNGFKLPDGIDAKAYLLHRGAEIEAQAHGESLTIRILCLKKYWSDILYLLQLLLNQHAYPQAELDIYLGKQKNRYDINMLKTDYRAQRAFNAAVFGSQHPFGYAIVPDAYPFITAANLQTYARQVFVLSNMSMYLAGFVDDFVMELLSKTIVQLNNEGERQVYTIPAFESDPKLIQVEYMPQTLQSSIMIGKLLPGYLHPDTSKIQFVNTLLGGYFGARLMQNLREEHGYTYGIHLTLSMNSKAGCLYISTDVGRDVTKPAVEQIIIELNKMIETEVAEEEIMTVRNVLMGKALRRIDGVFNAQYSLRNLHLNGANEAYFKLDQQNYFELTAYHIKETAKQYLNLIRYIR